MSKRNQLVITTPESRALQFFRKQSGLSVRKLAEKIKISKSRVHQFEVGNEDITDAYINIFLDGLGISSDQWNNEIGKPSQLYLLRKRCIDKIKQIDESKLELVYGLLSNF